MREHRVDKKLSVQKICRVCRDEKDVRSVLEEMWRDPSKAHALLNEIATRNQDAFEFEKVLNLKASSCGNLEKDAFF